MQCSRHGGQRSEQHPQNPGPREAKLLVGSPVGPGKTAQQITWVVAFGRDEGLSIWPRARGRHALLPMRHSAPPTQPQRPRTHKGPHGNTGSGSLLGQRGRFAESRSLALMTRAAMTRHLYSGGLGGLSFPELLALQAGICLPCLRVPSSTTLQELVECLSRRNRGPRATARDQRTLNGEAETMGSSIGDPPDSVLCGLTWRHADLMGWWKGLVNARLRDQLGVPGCRMLIEPMTDTGCVSPKTREKRSREQEVKMKIVPFCHHS